MRQFKGGGILLLSLLLVALILGGLRVLEFGALSSPSVSSTAGVLEASASLDARTVLENIKSEYSYLSALGEVTRDDAASLLTSEVTLTPTATGFKYSHSYDGGVCVYTTSDGSIVC